MIASQPESCLQEAVVNKGTWQRARVRSRAEIGQILERLHFALVGEKYSEQEIFAVCLALEEAMVNAIKHGHRDKPGQCVLVRFHIGPEQVLAIVKDRGNGFDPRAVPNPCDPENLERPTGRGLFLMHAYMTWVRHNARGNCVAMGKSRQDPPALPKPFAWSEVESPGLAQQAPATAGSAGQKAHVA
jgi:serine/threonine-protein kinase RsbW